MSHRSSFAWRVAATVVTVAAMLLGTRRLALAHASLVSSDPKAGSLLTASPTQIRLVFSEVLEPTLARMSLVDGSGHTTQLTAAGDPHDASALIAPVDTLATGPYRVVWRVVSADGHPVEGSFVFRVGESAASAPAPPDSLAMQNGGEGHGLWGASAADAPLVPALARGMALGATMALAGMLFFMSWPRAPRSDRRRARLALSLAVASPVLLALHLIAWLVHASPDHRLAMDTASAALASGVGKTELWRTGLALGSFWALALARRSGLAFLFAFAALLVSGRSGHAAAIHPFWTAPAKAVHLLAGAAWLGGLAWLLARERGSAANFRNDAFRVSGVALVGVVFVTLSGLVQVFVILPKASDLIHSAYGAIALAKAGGLLILAGFGAVHRYRILPRLFSDSRAPARFMSTLRLEILVMCLVILLGGILAYVPPPAAPVANMSQMSSHDMSHSNEFQ